MNRTQPPETLGRDLSPRTQDSRGQRSAVTCPPRPPLSIGGQGWDTRVRPVGSHLSSSRDRRDLSPRAVVGDLSPRRARARRPIDHAEVI